MEQSKKASSSIYDVVIFDIFDVLFKYKGSPSLLLIRGLFHFYAQYGGTQNIFEPVKSGVDLVHHFHDKGKRLFILSNIGQNEFLLLQEHFPHIFKLFEGIVYSGSCGFKKPDKAIYLYLLEKYNIEPAKALFIDDKTSNLIPAEHLGITTMVFPSKELEQTLFTSSFSNKNIKK